jgi:ATP-binding cassette, subfamily B, bacterial PglK
MPAITRVYQSINTLQFHNAAVTNLIEKQKEIAKNKLFNQNKIIISKNFRIGVMEFKDVSFFFKKSTIPTLNNISLKIPVSSTIALIGLTGAGKSTFVNLLLGLITPSSGKILHKGKSFDNDEIINFQKNVGYVPQSIYLLDDTIKSNIALGVSEKEIDMGKIIQASKYAQIYDFISNDLENKFDTIVGEKGARLSGGQIQRIGIARAFYNEPKYIILDEATSNLDIKTENQFIKSLESIKSSKTLIHVTHKSNVIRSADKIFVFDKGSVIVFESYFHLINSTFKKLIS